eukprot:g37786.t1
MKPTDSTASQSFLSSVTELLDNSMQERLDQLLSLDELTKALESFEKNKTPRSDQPSYYKILSMVIANWVRSALGSVIHPDKSCAVLGRKIAESLALIRDTIAYVQDWGVDTCLISLDQEKAFDRILHTYMWDILFKMGFGEKICNWIRVVYTNISASRLMSICDQFELASGAKVNRGQSEAMFFGNWADRSFIPFTIRTDYLKKLGRWEHRSLSIAGKNLVIKCEVLSVCRLEGNAVGFVEVHPKQLHDTGLCAPRHGTLCSTTRDSVLHGLFPGTHTETNISCAWRSINVVKDAPWPARNLLVFQMKELTLTECCRLAHSKVQDYVLRDALKLGAAAAKEQWGKTT